jgi:hypothetical protein
MLSDYVCMSRFHLLKQSVSFKETWYDCYTIEAYLSAVIFRRVASSAERKVLRDMV